MQDTGLLETKRSTEADLSRFGKKALYACDGTRRGLRFITFRWAGFKLLLGLADFVSHCLSLAVLFYAFVNSIANFEIDWNSFFYSALLCLTCRAIIYIDPFLDAVCCKELQLLSNRLELLSLKIQDKVEDNEIEREFNSEIQHWESACRNGISKMIVKVLSLVLRYRRRPFA